MTPETVFAAFFSTLAAVVSTLAAVVSTLAALVGTDAGLLATAADTREELVARSCDATDCAFAKAEFACCSALPVLNGSARAVAGTARTPHAITATRAQARTGP